jgi:hypothetical protein
MGFVGLPVLLAVFGRQYATSVLLVAIALPGIVLASGGRILDVHLNVLEKPQCGLLAGCARLAVLFPLVVFAYRITGLLGIGVAVMLSRIAWLLVLVHLFVRATGTAPGELIPRRSDLRVLFNSAAAFRSTFGRSEDGRRAEKGAVAEFEGRGLPRTSAATGHSGEF